MIHVHIHQSLSQILSGFKIGVVHYEDIVVSDSPQMLKGRLQFFQETIRVELENKSLSDVTGISDWRQVFKQLKVDPGRYRPSHEALYRRIAKGQPLPLINSAVDLNTFFSLEYTIPLGIYDVAHIDGNVTIRLGNETDHYEGVNGRDNQMANKLVSADELGAFGSPIVDSKRTIVTPTTTSALQLFYLRPATSIEESGKLLTAAAKMFTQIHGGEFATSVISDE
ncbi:B3/B4 domain-containing protein [Halalkalibacter oceani]|uniref:B3/B4 domain-containing protein n=1 Tax=Halalkalibacter oceani TaxID=1653776 RepID=UPI0032E7F872